MGGWRNKIRIRARGGKGRFVQCNEIGNTGAHVQRLSPEMFAWV